MNPDICRDHLAPTTQGVSLMVVKLLTYVLCSLITAHRYRGAFEGMSQTGLTFVHVAQAVGVWWFQPIPFD